MSRNIVLKNVRLSFPNLDEPSSSIEGGDKKYSATFLIDPTTKEGKANLKKLEAKIAELEKEVYGKSGVSYKEGRLALFDGNTAISQKTDEVYDGYADMMALKASNKKRQPKVVDLDAKTELELSDKRFPYGGCYVNAVVSMFAIAAEDKARGGRGIFATLEAVQFKADGPAFGAGPIETDEYFDDLSDELDDEEDEDEDDDDI